MRSHTLVANEMRGLSGPLSLSALIRQYLSGEKVRLDLVDHDTRLNFSRWRRASEEDIGMREKKEVK